MQLKRSFGGWEIVLAVALAAVWLALRPTHDSDETRSEPLAAATPTPWIPEVNGGDRLAQLTLRDGRLAQSIAFSSVSPPAYVSCAGEECERELRMRLLPGVYAWMESSGGSFVGRAIHASSTTVWVLPEHADNPHPEPSTEAQRAQRDTFLAGKATPTPLPSLAELIAALRSPDMEERVRATGVLRSLGPSAADAVPALIENLGRMLGGDDLQWLQIQASNALLAIGPRAALPPLIDAFQHGDPERADGAAHTIGQFGTDAESAVSILEAALDDPERGPAARNALNAIARYRAADLARSGPGIGELVSRKFASRPADDPKYFPLDPRYTWVQRITIEPAHPGAHRPPPFQGSVRNLPPETFDGVQATPQVWSALGQEGRAFVAADDTGVRLLATQGPSADSPSRKDARYLLRYPLEVGTEWSDVASPRFISGSHHIAGRSRIAGFETVTVPAGTYAGALKVVFRGVGTVALEEGGVVTVTVEAATWFAPGVGDVRYEQTDTVEYDELRSGRFSVELIRRDEL